MTSTNIFSGMANSNRNSSRVLRPPGGGSTDVLGLSCPEPPFTKKPNHSNRRNVSSVIEGTNPYWGEKTAVPEQKSPVKEAPAPAIEHSEPLPPTPVAEVAAPQEVAAPAPVVAVAPAPAPVAAEQPNRRVRVPPGGFSSGLW